MMPALLMDIWDARSQGRFDPSATKFRTVNVGGHEFLLCNVPRSRDSVEIGGYKNFTVRARLSGFRYRCLLIPLRDSGWPLQQWQIEEALSYCCEVGQIVLYNTFLSGGSQPLSTHFQCFPRLVTQSDRSYSLTALKHDSPVEVLTRQGDMPHFERISMKLPTGFPIPMLRIDIDDPADPAQLTQAAQKLYELAVTWHGLRAFNLYFVPVSTGPCGCVAYFIPRRRDGQAVPRSLASLYQEDTGVPVRWQFAALELGGTLQAKNDEIFSRLAGHEIAVSLGEVTPNFAEGSAELRQLAWSF
jgi:hypothetical protein